MRIVDIAERLLISAIVVGLPSFLTWIALDEEGAPSSSPFIIAKRWGLRGLFFSGFLVLSSVLILIWTP